MTPDDAEEYTQALGQVVAGGWRQIALGQRLGVPKALKLSTDQWVKQRLGGYVKLAVAERREAIAELKAADPMISNVAIADVIGVKEITVRRDLSDSTNVEPRKTVRGTSDRDSTNVEPLDTLAALATTQEMRQHSDTKANRAEREAAREDERQMNAAKVANVTDPRELLKHGRFATILIDPPWDFDDEGDVNHFGRGYSGRRRATKRGESGFLGSRSAW